MSKSQEHFNELIAQLLVRSQKMLNNSNIFCPYALLLSSDMDTELVKPLDVSDDLGEVLDLIQKILQKKVIEDSYVASAIAFANYESKNVIAYFEDNDNYCLKLKIPVSVTPGGIKLMPENIVTEDGALYVFPVS